MDDEDFGEHGIAPRQIVTSDNFKSEELQRKRKAMASAITSDSLLSHLNSTFLDFVVPEKLSIGVKLLRKMGWKEGQGVGPRYDKHQKKKKKKKSKPDGVKRYGCPLPDSDSVSEDSDDCTPDSVTFAPKDTCPISFVPKDNTHGLGYSGINVSAALPSGHISLFSEPYSTPFQPKSHKKRGGIQGKGFGVGALEDDDDDIYNIDSLSNYDQSIGGPEADDNLFGWTAPGRNKPGSNLPTSYVGKMLDGFTLAVTPLSTRTVYSLPLIPKGYKPFHVFKETPCDLKLPLLGQKREPLNAHSRSIVLGEINTEGSVFELLKKDDADRLTKLSGVNQKCELPENQVTDSGHHSQSISTADKSPAPPSATIAAAAISTTSQQLSGVAAFEPNAEITTTDHDKLTIKSFKIQSTQQLPQATNCLRAGFQPFEKDPAKQERYDRYLLLLKHGKIDPYDDVSAGCEMTEWERAKEKEEFSRSAKIFKPLSGLMATRFTAAKFTDDNDMAKIPIEDSVDKDDLSRAADMKLFGKLTRETFEWHPDQLLCRRFNVPDPHPGSGIIGIPKLKKDKYSIFNFLEASHSRESPMASKQPEKTISNVSTTASQSTELASSSKGPAQQDRPSIFSHLMEPSPTETKKTLPSATAEKVSESSASSSAPLTSKIDSTIEIKDGERPPLDLFKAIFADSSSSEDEDEDNELDIKHEFVSQAKSHNGEPSSVSMATENSIKGSSHPSNTSSSLKTQPETSAKNKFWDCVLTNEKESVSHVTNKQESPLARNQEKDSNDGEAYGPALPPTLKSSKGDGNKSTSHVDDQLLALLKNPPTKKHKHKSKHKSKKSKKVKHKHKKEKKHKDKKKKKHSSSKRRTSSSSGSSSSSSNSSPVHRKKKSV